MAWLFNISRTFLPLLLRLQSASALSPKKASLCQFFSIPKARGLPTASARGALDLYFMLHYCAPGVRKRGRLALGSVAPGSVVARETCACKCRRPIHSAQSGHRTEHLECTAGSPKSLHSSGATTSVYSTCTVAMLEYSKVDVPGDYGLETSNFFKLVPSSRRPPTSSRLQRGRKKKKRSRPMQDTMLVSI